MQIYNKSTANKKLRCHHAEEVDAHIDIAYIFFKNKNHVIMYSYNG